jgi:hypothetical protein
MRSMLALTLAISLPGVATADVGVPGFSRVPRDIVFEVKAEAPGYRFWFVSNRGIEPLELVPGRPVRVDGKPLMGNSQGGWIVAAPVGLVEGMGEAEFAKAVRRWELPPGVSRSELLAFDEEVPFWDPRSIVIDRCRVKLEPVIVRLVWLDRNASGWVRATWAIGGLLFAFATLWGGWWIIRRMRRLVRKVIRD